jgi:hypothetical protein
MIGHDRTINPIIAGVERFWGEIRQATLEAVQEGILNDKRDRAHMSTKRHKCEVIPRKRKSKVKASPLLVKLVTANTKKEH